MMRDKLIKWFLVVRGLQGLGTSMGGRPENIRFYLFFIIFIRVQLIYNVLVSGVQQSDSVIRMHMFIPFYILFSYKLSQNVEQSSLCYSVGPCRSSYIQRYVCLFIQTPDLSLWQPQLCYACESVSVLQIGSLVSYFRFHI